MIGSVAMVVIGFGIMFRALGRLEAMPRLAGPGTITVTLPAGKTTIFSETAGVAFACHVDGGTITRSGATRYEIDDVEGHAVLDIEVPRAGTYTVACDGDAPFVAAFGDNTDLVPFLIFGAIVPFLLGGGIIAFAATRRRRAMPLAVEPPVGSPQTSRLGYVLGGVLVAPWVALQALRRFAAAGLIELGNWPWPVSLFVLLGFILGGTIIAITASKRYKRRQGR